MIPLKLSLWILVNFVLNNDARQDRDMTRLCVCVCVYIVKALGNRKKVPRKPLSLIIPELLHIPQFGDKCESTYPPFQLQQESAETAILQEKQHREPKKMRTKRSSRFCRFVCGFNFVAGNKGIGQFLGSGVRNVLPCRAKPFVWLNACGLYNCSSFS